MVTLQEFSNQATADLNHGIVVMTSYSKVATKIVQFSSIEAGWLEGKGEPFNQDDLIWFINALVKHLPNHLTEPNATPTADGEVRLEWEETNQFLILETEVHSHQAYYFWSDRVTGQKQEEYLNLDQAKDWQWLVNQLQSKFRAADD